MPPALPCNRWSELSSVQLASFFEDSHAVVLLPVGAIEQHGAHLPVDVDIHLALSVCEAVADNDSRVLIAPPISWGYSVSHEPFSGTISLQPETLLAVLRDVAGSIMRGGCRTLVIVNGHNGNMGVLAQLAAEFGARDDGFVGVVNYFDLTIDVFQAMRKSSIGGEGHAGELETSLELYLRPDRVGETRSARHVQPVARRGFADLAQRGNLIQGFNLQRDYPEGVMGDPRPATAELGSHLFAVAVERLGEIVADLAECSAAR
jgi:creatinine amidohydrolase